MMKAEDIDLDQILNPTKYRLNFKRSTVSRKKSDKSLMSGVSMMSDMSQADTESPGAKGKLKKKKSMLLSDDDHINEDI
jgi:hypothetical protein